ncbi:NAD(P)-dependent malic enzyme [Archaeoglobus veneficus]|uniref:Malate dehydrogenase (Oxaloacetate-decarboxylating) (NADP(+)) n=1 Tax=Archaeoglobus veneficus (strain DSM 11195 / SNP6) TaxID=693661 RepID=F2KMI0_ARCVS|nr:NADP-dependent malic enzyme [Archaeoglobus veneficus]AEA47177.1 Malate dehydrogenase (oxaloacetate-decarboxylating) (NADP(+)) [Archaeoglobus veneficus SNP6]
MDKRTDTPIEKAKLPEKVASEWHRFYGGKIEVLPKCVIRNLDDFSVWYTPGVAKPCEEIVEDPDKAYDYTNKWNTVAVVSDGTRVLGLGDIGPLAALPVMEGKALLFKYLGGVDAFPVVLNEKDPDKFIEIVKAISPSFGGINLEDISNPKCFYILDRLREELDIPVWHDDQQGTATATLAALLGALKVVGKKIEDVHIAIIGVGAANIATIRLLTAAGADPKKMYVVDSKGILHPGRKDIEEKKDKNPYKWKYCLETNGEGRTGGMAEAIKGCDVLIAASKPGPGVIKKEWIATMNDDAIVFLEANPIPEMWPWEAKEAGARIVGTGRSDFPNQVNNSLVFPAVFRGVLDVRVRTITDEMAIAAAKALVKCAERKGLSEDYVIPHMTDEGVFPEVATATALKAIEQGVARLKLSREEIYGRAESIINSTQKKIRMLMELGFIQPPP